MASSAASDNTSTDAAVAPASVFNLDHMIERVHAAQVVFSEFTQEQVDRIFKKAALAANRNRIGLAKMAVEETGMGIVEDKVVKNHFASEMIFNAYKDVKTCGIVDKDLSYGTMKVAEPVGVVAGIVPTTNPTSTTIFKALLALKTRNGIVFSPHPRAKKCTIEAARIVLEAAVEAGAPRDIIGWIPEPTVPLSMQLMEHAHVSLILATGGPGMVRSAYSSGTPAIGVGPGNTPSLIDEHADVETAVCSVVMSKTFDNGMICASEQAVVAVSAVYDKVVEELRRRGCFILTSTQRDKVSEVLLRKGAINPAIVGQSARTIAGMAGIGDDIPKDHQCKILIGEVDRIGTDEPFSYEKLSPTLALYRAEDFPSAVDIVTGLVEFGGCGHTSVLYTARRGALQQERVEYFSSKLMTGRVLVGLPSAHGAIGDLFNFKLKPSLTLGCGSWGGNSTADNVGVEHLLNYKFVAMRRENMLWFRVPPRIYFNYGCLPIALRELGHHHNAFIVTDRYSFDVLQFHKRVTDVLDEMGVKHEVFYDINPEPDIETVMKGVEAMKRLKPDVMIAIGGGSPMDAAKCMRLMYEHPSVDFEGLTMRFMDIRKRVYSFPTSENKLPLVLIPTTSGTGSEVTPFTVIVNEKTGEKYPIADYELTPEMAIVDAELVATMPPKLTAFTGLDALTHAIEAYVSVLANDFTDGHALTAIELCFKHLHSSYKGDAVSREKMHHAATIAGMAFSNSFLGITHSMAHKLGIEFGLPHGLANAVLLPYVMKYNAVVSPTKQTPFSQYRYPKAIEKYARIADFLVLGGASADEKVARLIEKVERLKESVDVPSTIRDCGVDEAAFLGKVDELSERAFDDQCTGANPRFPLVRELRQVYLDAFYGNLELPRGPK